MENRYFVLFKRDIEMERQKRYKQKQRMLFDECREFPDAKKAKEFAIKNLPAVYAKQYPLDAEESQLRDPEKPYVVVGKYIGKYSSYCMGETEYMTTFDAVRCSKDAVEGIVEKLAGENNCEEVFVGLELKVIQ